MIYDMTKTLPGPDNISRRVFPNGVTVLIKENPSSAAVSVKGMMPCGAYLESNDKIGLTGFLAGCLTAGTASHDFQAIHTLLEGIGATLGFHIGSRSLSFDGHCLAEDLPAVLNLAKEVLDEPVFPEEHIEIFRRRVLSAYELHLHDPESMTDERFDELLYGDHPYGHPEYGSVSIINSITREDLCAFQQKYFGTKGMILTIAGGIRAEEVMDLCEKLFGTWNKPQADVDPKDFFPPVEAPKEPVSVHIEIPEKSEMALVMGTLAPSRLDPDYVSAVLGNTILGEFGMMGRLGRTVREENGLAYYVSSAVDSLHYGGCWSVEAGVNPANLEKAADLILAELRRFTSEKVSEEELDDVKCYFIGSLPLSLESNSGVASLMMAMENYGLGLEHVIRLPERIRAVSAERILETARKWLQTDRLIRVTAGTAAS